MRATQRQRESGLIQRLLDEPHRFQFVQAVRILVSWLARNGVPGDEALARVLRFENSLRLAFPPSEIEALAADPRAAGTAAGLLAALQAHGRGQEQGGPPRIMLTPAFIGFLGAGGTLPFHHTERIAAFQAREKDAGARAFLDTFSHRMVALFYQAWGKYRLEHRLDTEGVDGLLPLLMALGGLRGEAFSPASDGVGEDVAGYYAALLRTRPVAAATVSRVLSDYLGAAIEIEQFVGAWDDIPEALRGRLGGGGSFRLGYGATLGVRLWRHDLRVRLNIGPLDRKGLERFLPGSRGAAALARMLALFGVPNLQYEVRLILGAACVEPFVLTTRRPGAARRLGWDTFLMTGPGTVSGAAVRYLLRPSAAG